MRALSDNDVKDLLALVQATRDNLDRIEAKLAFKRDQEDDLDPGHPLNKSGDFLTPRGVEVCYRLFDQGKTRYAVRKALGISYGAATHRFHAWEKLGGRDRVRQRLD